MPKHKRPNDPRKIDYGPARPAINRSKGETESERYLAKLADRSFLNLWSYPNVFIDKKSGGKGDGKELCDLLVVCGDHVLIFSDKTIAWPEGADEKLSWRRWFKRAIQKSVNQIRGAERWIETYEDRLFLDRKCTEPFPLQLPPRDRRIVHGVVVALGAGDACKSHFNGGIGSLCVAPDIKGDAHLDGDSIFPFAVGDIDPSGPFIHILDDGTLDIVLGELDTITDFTSYLSKKESLIRSGKLLSAAGEEDLVAYYMTHMNKQDDHDFVKPDGSDFDRNDRFVIHPGTYEELTKNPQYRAKKLLDKSSYIWDRLIETFSNHVMAGTTVVPKGHSFDIVQHEESLRHLAVVSRYRRRTLGEAIIAAGERGRDNHRFTRVMLPGPTEREQETGFFFMTLAIPQLELEQGYEQYRVVRRNMLETYALSILRKTPTLKRVLGIATEPPIGIRGGGSSEDLILVEQPTWDSKLLDQLEERAKIYDVMQPENYSEYSVQDQEFPAVLDQPFLVSGTTGNRAQRRKMAAEMRKRKKSKRALR